MRFWILGQGLALEGREIENPVLQKGVTMLVDGHEPNVVKNALVTEMNETVARHNIGQAIFKSIGDAGPAMGMIGTLVGLVQMLSNMSDPKSIGPAMAVALLTTLYGAMLANMFALPVSGRRGPSGSRGAPRSRRPARGRR